MDAAFADLAPTDQDHAAPADELGRHLSDLLLRFAETVSAGEQEAAEKAAKIVHDAEAEAEAIKAEARQVLADSHRLVTATFKEAERRHDEVALVQARASDEITNAITRLTDALASLKAVPTLPDLTMPTHVFAPEPTVDLNEPATPVDVSAFLRLG